MGEAGAGAAPEGWGTDWDGGADGSMAGDDAGMLFADGAVPGFASVASKLSRYSSLMIRSPSSILLRLINLVSALKVIVPEMRSLKFNTSQANV
jgi:hypothetical protein